MHDARIYRKSSLSTILAGDADDEQFHILGNSAYPLETKLLVPYQDNDHLSPVQKKFN